MTNPSALLASDSLVVFDTEYTSWEGAMARGWSGLGEYREIVQIGAVRLDARNGLSETASLDIIVRPRINPRLSDYFIDLTGIGQERVDCEGVDIASALDAFARFLGTSFQACSNGGDERHLIENRSLFGLSWPLDTARFHNVRQLLADRAGHSRSVNSSDLGRVYGFTPVGRGHDALSDARNVAQALRIILKQD